MWWSAGAAASAHAGGRRLLDHCFDEFGGGHDRTNVNGTAVPVDTLGTSWEGVETGVHADPLVVRLVYWLVYVLASVVFLIVMLTIWPPRPCLPAQAPRRASHPVVPRRSHARLRRHRLARG